MKDKLQKILEDIFVAAAGVLVMVLMWITDKYDSEKGE